MELLVKLIEPKDYVKAHTQVRQCQHFRDPNTGKTHPRLTSVLKMQHLTAERRVRAMFYWAHVLGTNAEIVVEELRTTAQVAVATLQVLLIATRGHRSYTQKELDVIFLQVGGEFFKSLETISQYLDNKRLESGRKKHAEQPHRIRDPLPFTRVKR